MTVIGSALAPLREMTPLYCARSQIGAENYETMVKLCTIRGRLDDTKTRYES
jgi:hypothetical protein